MEKIPCFFMGKKFFIENESGYDYRKSQVEISVNGELVTVNKNLKKIVKITDVATGVSFDCREHGTFNFETVYDTYGIQATPCLDTVSDTRVGIEFSNKATIAFGKFQATAEEVGENLKKLGELLKENEKENENKGEKNMFNFEFGKATGVCMSLYGVAFQTGGLNDDGIAYKDGGWVEVPKQLLLNNKSLRDMLYVMPVAKKDVKVNDFIKHNNHWCRVAEVTDTTLKVEDVFTKTIVEILPTRSPFGFDFYSKLVNLFDGFGFGAATANEENPFGNIGMMMMLADGDMGDNLLPLMMMSGGKMDMSNPMMMYFLLKK